MNHRGQQTLFSEQRMGFDEALDLTASSLNAYAPRYHHWAIAYSGGKDSSATLTAVLHLIDTGKVKAPSSLTVLYSDTRMELAPLWLAASEMLASLPFDNVNPDGSTQPIMRALMV